jgi:hypothetical protein
MVAQVADGDAHQLGLEGTGRLFYLVQVVVISKHQIQHFHGMTGRVQMPGNIGKANGQWLGIHAAIELLVTVRGNQQDAHYSLL